MIHYEILKDRKDIFKYQEAWNRIFESGEYEPSTSFEWTYSLLSTHLKADQSFLLIIIKESDEMLGAVPLVLSKTKKYGLSLISLSPISEFYNTHSDIMITNSDEVAQTLLAALFSLKDDWDVLRIGHFIETNPLLSCLEASLQKMSIKYEMQKAFPSFFIEFRGSYNDYLMNRSGKFRNYLKRMDRKLNMLGDIEFHLVGQENNISEAFNKLLYIEERSWKNDNGTSINVIRQQENFYGQLCKASHEKGEVHLVFLYLNREPIAYNLGLIKNDIYFYLKTSYVETFKKVSPATVLRAKLIEHLISIGVKKFDFPGEPYEWERQWTDCLRRHKSLIVYNKSLKARLLSMYNSIKQFKNKYYESDQMVYHDARALKPQKN